MAGEINHAQFRWQLLMSSSSSPSKDSWGIVNHSNLQMPFVSGTSSSRSSQSMVHGQCSHSWLNKSDVLDFMVAWDLNSESEFNGNDLGCGCEALSTLPSQAEYWLFLTVLSKALEFVDTIFLVLRKKPLIFLHWLVKWKLELLSNLY